MESRLQKLAQLPSLPTVAVRLLKMFSDPDVSIADVVFLLQSDPALSGRILKAANTSQYGLKKPVSDLNRAVVLLGKKSVTALALGFSLAEASMSTGPYANYYADFWFQSLVRGCAASLLAERYGGVDPGEAFTIGLLARIGRLALLNLEPQKYVACLEESEETGMPLDQVQAQRMEFSAQQITYHLLEEWKLPEHCLSAVNDLERSLDEVCDNRDVAQVTLDDILRIASAFGEFFSGEGCGLAVATIYELTCAILGGSEDLVNELVDAIRRDLDDHSDLFSVDMSKVGSPLELLSQAMSQLSNLAAQSSMPQESRNSPMEILEENSRLRRRVLELTQSSMTDTLTGLFNRTVLNQQLQEWAFRARQNASPMSLIFLDIDHFKSFNDIHGHAAGDHVLQCVARAVAEVVRESEIAVRYGGEEFVVLADVAEKSELEAVADRIRHKIDTLEIVHGTQRLHVTVSVGAATASPIDEDPLFGSRLLQSADAAMYVSKREGRNRVTVVDALAVSDSSRSPLLESAS